MCFIWSLINTFGVYCKRKIYCLTWLIFCILFANCLYSCSLFSLSHGHALHLLAIIRATHSLSWTKKKVPWSLWNVHSFVDSGLEHNRLKEGKQMVRKYFKGEPRCVDSGLWMWWHSFGVSLHLLTFTKKTCSLCKNKHKKPLSLNLLFLCMMDNATKTACWILLDDNARVPPIVLTAVKSERLEEFTHKPDGCFPASFAQS